jgi:hypothetical protein
MKHTFLLAALVGFLVSCTENKKPLAVEVINSPADSISTEPYLFTDPYGNIHLTWIERIDTINYLKLSHWQNDQWSAPVTITSGYDWFVNWADYPLCVGDGQGKYMAHILKKSGTGTFAYDVAISHSADGTSWSDPTVLHDDGKQAEHGFVSFVPYGENVFVSWLDGRNTVGDEPTDHDDHGHHGEMTVRAAVLSYDGNKLNEWELDNRVCDCCQTTSAITKNGPVVIYRDRSETEVRDMSIVRFVNNTWTEPKAIYNDNWEISGCPVNGPRCEARENTLALAWFTMGNNKPSVNVIFSDDGGETFNQPIQLNQSEEAIGRVDLVLLDEETAVVSWMEGTNIHAAQVTKQGNVERLTVLAESSQSRSSGFPQLTKGEGFIMAAWTDAEAKTVRTAKLQ